MIRAMSGPTPLLERSLAPDLARGGMLLLIALANVHNYLYSSLGVRGYPAGLAPLDQVVVLVQMLLVDGRAYPLFALLFGYGITQLAWRRASTGAPADAVESIVRRRGVWMVAIGFLHALLLFSGDIVGAYGLVAVVLAGVLVRAADTVLVRVAAAGVAVGTLSGSLTGFPLPTDVPDVRSIAQPDALLAVAGRVFEWLAGGPVLTGVQVVGMVALGAWAARRRLLDDPVAHLPLLRRVAIAGIPTGVVLGLPLALHTAELAGDPSIGLGLLHGALHTLGGFAAGVGYTAAFGLLALRVRGPVADALAATGRRSLSCYLAQSVAFAALLPAWSLGLGGTATPAQAALLGVGVWLVTVVAAVLSERSGVRGPAETLLRRLTYGSGR
jgi:uncharacterized membrane protein YeiB